MKKFIVSLFSFVLFLGSQAQQNVGIGTTTPNSSAILDLTSTTRALLIPRMTFTERGAIVSPAAGMIVYQTNTVGTSAFGFYVYEGVGLVATWKRLAKSDEVGSSGGSWTVSGNNQYSNVSGSVGIGTTTPHVSTLLDIAGTTKGVLFPRMTSVQREAIPSPPTSLMVYDIDQAEYFEYDQTINRWKKLNYWIRPAVGNRIISADSVGISTSPLHKLHIIGGNIFLADNRNGAVLNPHLMFDVPAVDYKEAGLQFRRNTDTLASINYVAHPTFPNYFRFSASENGAGPDTYISNTGVGIGYADPQVMLHLRRNSTEEMVRLEGQNPMIKFRKYNGLLYDDIGFIQTVDNDLRIGTFGSNTTGDLIIRTGGTDNLMVDDNGDVGIGADAMISALAKLHITNGQDAGLTTSTNGYIMLGVGSGSSDNLVIDNNEIVARSGYSTNSTLFLQNNGGPLAIGGPTTISAKTTINEGGEAIKLNGVDPAINLYVSGIQKGYLWQTGNNLQLGTSDPLGKVLINANKIQISSINVPDGYRLGVGGKVLCEEVRVKMQSAGWPDYVFDDEYKLLPLEELAAFIKKNKHLPNIPAAAEVDKEGMELGDMQRRMMEKIEELTLYIIKQQKEIDDLKTMIKK
jgi:hypothetical protein